MVGRLELRRRDIADWAERRRWSHHLTQRAVASSTSSTVFQGAHFVSGPANELAEHPSDTSYRADARLILGPFVLG